MTNQEKGFFDFFDRVDCSIFCYEFVRIAYEDSLLRLQRTSDNRNKIFKNIKCAQIID